MNYNNIFPNNFMAPNNQMPIQQPYGQPNNYQAQSGYQPTTPNMPYNQQPMQPNQSYQASYRPSNQPIPDLSYNSHQMQPQYGHPTYGLEKNYLIAF